MTKSHGVLANLPEELKYLIDPALNYGTNQFDSDIFNFLDNATPEQMSELESIAQKVFENNRVIV